MKYTELFKILKGKTSSQPILTLKRERERELNLERADAKVEEISSMRNDCLLSWAQESNQGFRSSENDKRKLT